MNDFLNASLDLVKEFGAACTYSKVQQDAEYDVETGTVITSEISYNIIAYKKHIRANQFNYPSLVGKSLAMFYVANNLAFKPEPNDGIIYDGSRYSVEDVQEVHAEGQIVLYKLLGVKS